MLLFAHDDKKMTKKHIFVVKCERTLKGAVKYLCYLLPLATEDPLKGASKFS